VARSVPPRPCLFGLAFSLLLIATYPQRKQLIPSTTSDRGKTAVKPTPAAEDKPAIEEEKEAESAKS
jgi:hypothetical protein